MGGTAQVLLGRRLLLLKGMQRAEGKVIFILYNNCRHHLHRKPHLYTESVHFKCKLIIMKALKCKTLRACVAWQVMVLRQIADDDSEVQLYNIEYRHQ